MFVNFRDSYEVKHKKTGNIYTVLDDDVPDTTNSENNKRMVWFISKDKKPFVREYNEFKEKFERI